jgi:glutathione S-transferase
MPDITLYFLQASRAIRVAWLLAELNLDYTLEFFPREKERAPPDFKERSGNPLGKSPFLRDGNVGVGESGAICEYLCQKYDKEGRLTGGNDDQAKARILEWTHAAEGTFAIHALALLYAKWNVPADSWAATEKALSVNVQKDLDWLDSELAKSKSGWLVGDHLSLADIMVHFSVEFIFARRLGVKGREGDWKNVEVWEKRCRESASFKRAVEKSGYTLFPETGVNWRQFLE